MHNVVVLHPAGTTLAALLPMACCPLALQLRHWQWELDIFLLSMYHHKIPDQQDCHAIFHTMQYSTPCIDTPIHLVWYSSYPCWIFLRPIVSIMNVHNTITGKLAFIWPEYVSHKLWIIIYGGQQPVPVLCSHIVIIVIQGLMGRVKLMTVEYP